MDDAKIFFFQVSPDKKMQTIIAPLAGLT